MATEHLVAFNLALLVAVASPGPALLVALQTTLSAGRKAGMAVGYGLGLMAALWTLMALFGLAAIFNLFPFAYAAAKIAGALYLIYIAVRMWAGAKEPISPQAKPAQRGFRDGVLINLLNPKPVLFATAVLVVIFPPQMSSLEKVAVALNHFMVEVIFYQLLTRGMSTPAVRESYLRAKAYLDRTASVVLGALGVRLLLSR